MNAKLPPNLDPNDPNIGSTYRSDVVRDVTDFRTASGSREVGEDRIKSLEDRIAWLEARVAYLEARPQQIQVVPYTPIQPYNPYGPTITWGYTCKNE